MLENQISDICMQHSNALSWASQRFHDDLGYESGSHVTCLSHTAGASNVKCVMWVNRERNVANFKLDNEIKKVL